VTRREAMLSTSSATELLAGQMVSGSAGIQLLSGLAAVVLGILAVAGQSSVADFGRSQREVTEEPNPIQAAACPERR
jgi:hypothetical protein